MDEHRTRSSRPIWGDHTTPAPAKRTPPANLTYYRPEAVCRHCELPWRQCYGLPKCDQAGWRIREVWVTPWREATDEQLVDAFEGRRVL